MSKISLLLILAATLGLPHGAMAITNAELARLNNELIGLDAQLAVAKKKNELEKYRASATSPQSSPAPELRTDPARPSEQSEAEPKLVRKSKRDAAGDLQGETQPDGLKSVSKKPRAQ